MLNGLRGAVLFAGAMVGALVCSAPVQQPPATTRTEADPQVLLRAHNAARGEVNVPPLTWASDLARLAQGRATRLAEQCRLAHLPLPDDVGENVLLALPESGGADSPVTGWPTDAQVVEAWVGERRHYSYPRNSCAPGHDCLHYTQIVWAATKEVGCATAICPAGGRMWVCDYRPAGNIPGQRPY